MDSAIQYLTNKLKTWRDDALLLDGEYLHVRCCAHILNLLANEGLGKIDKSIVSIRNAVKYMRSSTPRFQSFKIRVEEEKILGPNGQISGGNEILDYHTWWNSTYIMSMTTLKFKSASDRIANQDRLYNAYFHEK